MSNNVSFCKKICSCFYATEIPKTPPPTPRLNSIEFNAAIGNYKKHKVTKSTDMITARTMVRWDSTSFNKYVREHKNDNPTS